MQNCGSKKGGGYVTLTVSESKFVSLEWKDANEKATHYMGRRHVVYTHTKFEGTGDIAVEARFYYKSLNGKQYLTNFAPLRIEQDDMAKKELSLTSSQVEEITQVYHPLSPNLTVTLPFSFSYGLCVLQILFFLNGECFKFNLSYICFACFEGLLHWRISMVSPNGFFPFVVTSFWVLIRRTISVQ